MKMKTVKTTAILLCMVIFAGVFAGCGTKEKGSEDTVTEGTGTTDNAPKNSGAITLKVGHVEPEERSTHIALLDFKKEVEEKSNGEILIDIHPNGVLGGDVQLTESVAMGTLDMALPATSVLTTYSPEFGVLDMPYLFTSTDKAFAAMDGSVGQHFDQILAGVGITNLGYSFNGLRSTTNSVKPIAKPEDLKGIKMRVMESPVFIDFFETLGANATPMSFSELFTGLQQKTVEGQENPPSLIYSNKFYEVQKYLSLTEHVNNFLAFIMNSNKYDKLTPEQQQILVTAAKNFTTNQRQLELNDTEKYVGLLGSEGGLEVNRLSEEDKTLFKNALVPMYEKYRAQLGAEIFELAEQYN